MTPIDPNCQAFPGPGAGDYGLTIRAEFAKAAMQGLLANPLVSSGGVAEYAVQQADALIAALNQPKTP